MTQPYLEYGSEMVLNAAIPMNRGAGWKSSPARSDRAAIPSDRSLLRRIASSEPFRSRRDVARQNPVSIVLLEMRDIKKSFGATRALSGVSISVDSGEALALLGENGAGKSTLISILGGIVRQDSGDIVIDGKVIGAFQDVQAARRAGIAVIHQEIVLVPHLTVAENIYLGREPTTRLGFKDRKLIDRNAREAIASLELDLDATTPVRELSTARQQMVEIVKAISQDARIVVMDEPTSSLSLPEVEQLFAIVERLKKNDVAIIYISHRLEEIFTIADRVTVIRDGAFIGTKPTAETDQRELVQMMVGRSLSAFYSRRFGAASETLLTVDGLTKTGVFEDVSFSVRKGEVLGFAGLVGAGRSEIMASLFGASGFDEGAIVLDGENVRFRSPREAIANGVAMVPEDRKGAGLVLSNSVGFNLTLAATRALGRGPFLDFRKRDALIRRLISQHGIKTKSPWQAVSSLSGGNQQKVVVAKWLATEPKILILDEPTRGVDIGAKREIYAIIDDLARGGMGVILVSSELEEILNLCDAVCVVRAGRIVKTLARDELSQETIMKYAAGADASTVVNHE
jgi:ribose transport system ATP-binding protein